MRRWFEPSLCHNQIKTYKYMKKKRGHYKLRKNCLQAVFRSIAEGDVMTLQMAETNVSSIRTRASMLNREAGFMKYRVSVDSLMGVVRIANSV